MKRPDPLSSASSKTSLMSLRPLRKCARFLRPWSAKSEVVAADRLLGKNPGGDPGVTDGAFVDHVGAFAEPEGEACVLLASSPPNFGLDHAKRYDGFGS